MNNLREQIEHVAQAFYEAENDGQGWAYEPESLKNEFREHAREAIELLEELREQALDAA